MGETRFAIHSRVRLVEVTLDGLVDLTETRKVMGRLSRRQDLPRSFNLLISVARRACLSELTLPEFRRHRALTEGLSAGQSEEEFNSTLDASIQTIFDASVAG